MNNQFNLTFETELNEGVKATTLTPVFFSGDDQAHSFVVKAFRDGQPVSMKGATVHGYFIRPDNVTITLEGTVNADGDAVVTLSEACYNKQGRFQLVIRVTMNNVISTLFCGYGGLVLAMSDGYIDEDGVVPSLGDLLAQIEVMEEATANANKATAAANEAAARANNAANNAGSATPGSNMPDYVVTEAMEVLDKVVAAQGNRTFVLGAITDMHYGSNFDDSSDYIDGVIHATQGLKHIADRIKLDALAVLGDYTDEHQIDTDTAITDREECNALLATIDADKLCLKGNHDHTPGADAQTFRTIMANSDNVVWGSRIGGYFYRDFDAYKLRIICLNTTEVARDDLSVSAEQCKWFADTLDVSAKEDASEWAILLLSHHPLDFTVKNGNYRFAPIINAYYNGTSWTDGVVSCDYTGKNAAPIIANIHGHLHNLLTSKMYIGAPGSSAQMNVYRLCTPASRVDYVNHYSAPWIESTWYNKTKNTAEDTSFCIYCIDLDDRTVKAFCYGAGYDRVIAYSASQGGGNSGGGDSSDGGDEGGGENEGGGTVNLIDTVGYQDGMRVNSSGSYVDATGYTSTNKISVTTGDVFRTHGVNFDAAEHNYCHIHFWANDGTQSYIVTNSVENLPYDDNNFNVTIDDANDLVVTIKNNYAKEITFTGYGSGANLVVTKNQVIPEGVTFARNVDGSVTLDNTNFSEQGDGSVNIEGTSFTDQGDGSVLLS